jgi:hypothetical protein
MRTTIRIASVIACLASATVFAQGGTPTPSPGAQPTDPSAASTPHQRAAVKAPSGAETPAASSGTNPGDSATPAQKDQIKKTHKAKKPAAADGTPPASP